MSKKKLSALICMCLAAFLFVAVTTASGQAKKMEMTYSIFFPATHTHTLLATEWCKEIEKRTNGAVKINMFPGATLTPPDQAYDGVVKGISDGYDRGQLCERGLMLSEVIDRRQRQRQPPSNNAYFEKFKPKEFDDGRLYFTHGPFCEHQETVTKLKR
jgi:hypothetical protein